MPHHDWSDDDFDWKSLNKAINTIHKLCVRYGRIGIHSKEKFGTHRCSTYFFSGHFHDLTHPGYVASRYPKWLWKLDIYHSPKFFKYTGLTWLIRKYQALVYKLVFLYVCTKYLHIVDEIVSDVDGYEIIWRGKEIHDKYWRQV